MRVNKKWRKLGWRHPLWDYIRFCSVVQRQRQEQRDAWVERLRNNGHMEIDTDTSLPVPKEHVKLFFAYLESRKADFEHAKCVLPPGASGGLAGRPARRHTRRATPVNHCDCAHNPLPVETRRRYNSS